MNDVRYDLDYRASWATGTRADSSNDGALSLWSRGTSFSTSSVASIPLNTAPSPWFKSTARGLTTDADRDIQTVEGQNHRLQEYIRTVFHRSG